MDTFFIIVNGDIDAIKFTELEANEVYDSRVAENSLDDVCVIKVDGIITKQT